MVFTELEKKQITVTLTGGSLVFTIDAVTKMTTLVMRGVDKFTEKNAAVESEVMGSEKIVDLEAAVQRIKDIVTA